MPMAVEAVSIALDEAHRVSGLRLVPPKPRACYLFAHGAGAGMSHPFMESAAAELGNRGIATLRYQFPYMEKRTKRPDSSKVAQATVRAAASEATRLFPDLPLFAGGKSFGGRMTSQAQSQSPLPLVRGLIFFGFPLHPAGRPSVERATHLFELQVPMLFLQGERDALADPKLLEPLIDRLGARASLKLVAHADHSFHVPASAGRKDVEVRSEILDAAAAWIDKVLSGGR